MRAIRAVVPVSAEEVAPHDVPRLLQELERLRSELDEALETLDALHGSRSSSELDLRQARAAALRDAALLIRDGYGADALERYANSLEAPLLTTEALAEDYGIDLEESDPVDEAGF